MKHSFHNIYFPDKSKLVKGVSSVILIMGAMLVSSKGIAGPAVLVTHLAWVARGFHVGRLDVLQDIRFHFGLPPTEHALPLTVHTFLHLWLDIAIQFW